MWKVRRLMLAAALLAPVLLSGCSKEWREFSSEEGKFSILMPGFPGRKDMPILDMTMTAYGADLPNVSYMVAFVNIPSSRPFSMEHALQGMCGHHKATVLSRKNVAVEGKLFWEFEMESKNPKGYIAGRMGLHEGRWYVLIAGGNQGRLSNPEVRRWLDSFRIKK